MEIIDCHTNIGWDVNNLRKNQFPTEQSFRQLLAKMDNYDVSQSIIVPFPSPGGQFDENTPWYHLENHNLITAARFSKRLLPFPAVNPADERSVKNIKELAVMFGVKGVKFSHQELMNFSIDALINHPLMKIIQDNDLIMMIHIGTGKEKSAPQVHTTLNYAIKVAKHYPAIKFIFCHLGRLHWSLFDALNLNNVCMDTAGLSLWSKWSQFIAAEPVKMLRSSTPVQVIEKLVGIGYENKIIFGSDEPYTNYQDEIGLIKKAEISEPAKRKIFAENIKKLLGLKLEK